MVHLVHAGINLSRTSCFGVPQVRGGRGAVGVREMAVWMQTKSLYSETNYCLENNRRVKSLKTSTLKSRKQETNETKDSRL